MVDSTDYGKWLFRASQDIRTIENNFKDDPEFLASVNCYLAQQAAEKILKAFLLAKGKALPKTHDLLFLAKKCSEMTSQIHVLQEDLELLNLYSIEARYPGDFFDVISAIQAERAYQSIIRLKTFIGKEIGL